MEVMGLMLGQFVDDYTVKVVDVFAMPQSGTGVSVEAVDPVFQTKMLDMLQQTGRGEMVVGWYHSHPGFGCWLCFKMDFGPAAWRRWGAGASRARTASGTGRWMRTCGLTTNSRALAGAFPRRAAGAQV